MRSKKMSPTAITLMMLETSFHSVGEFLKELAVLNYVFVPLDLWKDHKVESKDLSQLVRTTILLFVVGMALEWTANIVQRGREIYEEEEFLI